MAEALRILLIEDNPLDALLSERCLRKAGLRFASRRVDTKDELREALGDFDPHIVLADFHLPGFDGFAALDIVRAHAEQLPVIFVSGAMEERTAVEGLARGAQDFVMKDRLARLPAAVRRALAEHTRALQVAAGHDRCRFRAVFESLERALVVLDDAGRVLEWNPAAAALFGYTQAEAAGQEIFSLIADARERAELRSLFEEMRSGDARRWSCLASGRTRDGRALSVVLRWGVMRVDDATEGLLLIETESGMDRAPVGASCGSVTAAQRSAPTPPGGTPAADLPAILRRLRSMLALGDTEAGELFRLHEERLRPLGEDCARLEGQLGSFAFGPAARTVDELLDRLGPGGGER